MPNYVSECKSKNLLLLGQVTTYISYYFRKAILEYCKVEGKSNRNNVLMEFVRRIESNSTAIRTLVETSIKKDSKSYLKLPIGLLIRSCLIDSIVGLYLSAVDDKAASDIISDFNQDYVRSMPDRYEVYSDRCAASKLDDSLLKHMYGLQIEDNYPNYIDWSSYHRDESLRSGFFKVQSSSRLTIAKAYKFLKEDTRYSSVAKKLYAYYREYSQYEHFSVYAHGSYISSYDDDNPSMAKPFEYVAKAVGFMVSNMNISETIERYCNEASKSVVKLLLAE